MTKRIKANPSLLDKVFRYYTAKKAKARWEEEEKKLKAELLEELGYDEDDPKPEPVIVEDEDGNEVFAVKRGTWRGLNQKYLKDHHPQVYAECEASKATLTIKYDGESNV
jgi:hypothetical protein